MLVCAATQEFLRRETEALNGRVDPGPLLGKKFLAFALQEQIAGAGIDEHAAASLAFDKLFVDELLVGLENGEGIDAIFGSDIAYGGEWIAFLEHAIENHRDNAFAKLAVNRLAVVPLTIHDVFQVASSQGGSGVLNEHRSARIAVPPGEKGSKWRAVHVVIYLTTTLVHMQEIFWLSEEEFGYLAIYLGIRKLQDGAGEDKLDKCACGAT